MKKFFEFLYIHKELIIAIICSLILVVASFYTKKIVPIVCATIVVASFIYWVIIFIRNRRNKKRLKTLPGEESKAILDYLNYNVSSKLDNIIFDNFMGLNSYINYICERFVGFKKDLNVDMKELDNVIKIINDSAIKIKDKEFRNYYNTMMDAVDVVFRYYDKKTGIRK